MFVACTSVQLLKSRVQIERCHIHMYVKFGKLWLKMCTNCLTIIGVVFKLNYITQVPGSYTCTHRRIDSDVVLRIVFILGLIIKKNYWKSSNMESSTGSVNLLSFGAHIARTHTHRNIIFAYYKTRTSYAVISCLLLIRPANRYHKLCTYNIILGYNIIYTDIILKNIRGTKRA